MGTIRKRGNGYYAEVYQSGKRKGKTHRTKREAQSWINDIESGIQMIASGNARIADLKEKYKNEVLSLHKGAKQDKLRLDLITSQLPDKPINKLTPAELSEWKNNLLQTLSSGTVRRYMGLLNGFFNHCLLEWQLIDRNPLKGVKKPPAPPSRQAYPLDSDIELILPELGYSADKPVTTKKQQVAVTLLLALETAMRAGEMLKIRHKDIDYANGVLTLYDTKNGDAREVPLSKRARELLKKVSPDYFSVSSATHSTLFRRACIDAGVEGIRFHDSRAAGLMRLSKKLNVLDLARVAGMRNPKTLMIYYRKTARDLADQLD